MKPGNRQFIDMVPIHTKRFALEDGREDVFTMPFCHFAERLFRFFQKNDITIILNPINKNLKTGTL